MTMRHIGLSAFPTSQLVTIPVSLRNERVLPAGRMIRQMRARPETAAAAANATNYFTKTYTTRYTLASRELHCSRICWAT